ncbi:MAG: M20/M25/M40 family metallo-hydrolase [bacterium]
MKETFIELVKLDSPSGGEREVQEYLAGVLKPYAEWIEEDSAAGRTGGNCGNLFAYVKGNREGAPTILLNAHTDNVEPCRGVRPVVEGGVVRSDGSTVLGADDKAGVSIVVEIVRALEERGVPHGGLLLLFTVSEEKGLMGSRRLEERLLRADFGYSVDGSGAPGTIVARSPTHDTIRAEVRGRAAHAGIEPEKGINAVQAAAAAVAAMRLGRIDAETTANVGVIRGGYATNIVPPSAHIEGEARSHDLRKLEAQIGHMRRCIEEECARAGAEAEVKVEREYDALLLSETEPAIERFVNAARGLGVEPRVIVSGGGYDANNIAARGVPTAPVSCGVAAPHTTEERLDLAEFELCARILFEAVRG